MNIHLFYADMKKNGAYIEYYISRSYTGVFPEDLDDSYYKLSYIEKEEYLIAIGGEPVSPAFGYQIIIRNCPVNQVYIENPEGWTDAIFGIPMVEGGYLIKHEYRYEELIEAIPAVYW